MGEDRKHKSRLHNTNEEDNSQGRMGRQKSKKGRMRISNKERGCWCRENDMAGWVITSEEMADRLV